MNKARLRPLRWTVLVTVALIVPTGCGVVDGLDRLEETVDESLDEANAAAVEDVETGDLPTSGNDAPLADWFDYADPTSTYSVDFPTEPVYVETEQVDQIVRTWVASLGSDGFAVSELDLQLGVEFDFDAGIDGALENATATAEEVAGGEATYTIVEEVDNSIDGHEGRRYVAVIDVDGEPFSTVTVVNIVVDNLAVSLTAVDVDSDNSGDAERFLDSFTLLP